MKRPAAAFAVSLLVAVSAARAAEVFEAYPKETSLGYVANEVKLRRWLNAAWGLEAGGHFQRDRARERSTDGVTRSEDRTKVTQYSFSVAGVRTIKNFAYFDLNIKAGAGYLHGNISIKPEGPNNDITQKTAVYFLFAGPEVEIKLPYFSRLVVVSSIQATYGTAAQTTKAFTGLGPRKTKLEETAFGVGSDGNSLAELFQIGVRYYF